MAELMGIAIDKKRAAGIINPGFEEILPGETARAGFYASQESVERNKLSGVKCDHCGLEFEEGYRPDPCLGRYLPDVASACCGHGVLSEAVVTVGDGALPDQVVQDIKELRYLWGEDALDFFDAHGVGPRKLRRDPRRKAFWVVDDFEDELASYCGAPLAVAVDSCTNAIFLSLVLEARRIDARELTLPARTYSGVAQAALNAGWSIRWDHNEWAKQYPIPPTRVVDAALNLSPDSYEPGTLTCLSFHAAKQLPVGIGGAILLDDDTDCRWLRAARMDGRQQGTNATSPQQPGFHCFMPPDIAARALWLLTALKGEAPHPARHDDYPDLSVLIG